MKDVARDKKQARLRRRVQVRKRLSGTPDRPRLAVFRSHAATYAQIVDDVAGRTLAAADSRRPFAAEVPEGLTGKCAAAYLVGRAIAEKSKEKGVESVVFDRSGYLYHGRVAALARGARDGGLKF